MWRPFPSPLGATPGEYRRFPEVTGPGAQCPTARPRSDRLECGAGEAERPRMPQSGLKSVPSPWNAVEIRCATTTNNDKCLGRSDPTSSL